MKPLPLRTGIFFYFFFLFGFFFYLWRPDFQATLLADFDTGGFYHLSFYRPGILKPFFFWQLPEVTPFYEHASYYSPLPDIIFSFLLRVFGEWRVPFHFFGFFLHGTNALLLYLFCKELTGRRLLGMLASPIFLFHPENIQTVSDLSRSFESPMVIFFSLFSLGFFLRFLQNERKSNYGISLFFLWCACFCKITALTLIPVVVFLDFFLFGRKLQGDRYFPFILTGLLFAAVALWLYPRGAIPHAWGGSGGGVFSFLRLVEFNTWLLFPFYLSLGEPFFLLLATFLVMTTLVIWGNGLVKFLALWMVEALALFTLSNFRPLGELYKYIYISTVPFSILLSQGLLVLIQKAKFLRQNVS